MKVQVDTSGFPTPRFPVGTVYRPAYGRECTVCNRLYTFDDTGTLIKIRYEAIYMHAGQEVKMYDIREDRIEKFLVSVPKPEQEAVPA